MIPVRNENADKGIPYITILLIAACIAAFTLQHVVYTTGLVPLDFVYSVLHPSRGLHTSLFVLIIAFFLHGSLIHLLSNMWFLWIFGSAAERVCGIRNFLIVYLLCGIASMLIQVASSPLSTIPIVGASGAIAGIMGFCLIVMPFSKVLVFFPPVFLFRVPSFVFLLLWFIIQYLNLRASVQDNGGGIAWWAHVGGYITGVVFAIVLQMRGMLPSRARSSRRQRNA